MTYVFPPVQQASLPIKGSDKLFPVHRIYCVGRNYDEHTREMGGDTKDPPFFFQKNADNVATNGKFPYPSQTKNVHFEVEMVVGLKSGGTNIKAEDALKHVFGYAVGIDMTRRDLQDAAKKLARPWEVAKAFEYSAPCTALVPADSIGHPKKGAIWLDVNGERRQTGNTRTMIFNVAQVVADVSRYMTLLPGDVITTGTPPGVALGMKPPVWLKPGDIVTLGIQGLGEQRQRVVPFRGRRPSA